jgi:ABC-type bacteriocin/lantibiotic exporter with double-glycine peptidase domain
MEQKSNPNHPTDYRLEEQIGKAFEFLSIVHHIKLTANEIHLLLHHRPLTPDNALQLMEEIGQDHHLSLRLMRLSEQDVIDKQPTQCFLLRPNLTLAYLISVDKKSRTVELQFFDGSPNQSISIKDLFSPHVVLTVLSSDGKAGTFIDDEHQAPHRAHDTGHDSTHSHDNDDDWRHILDKLLLLYNQEKKDIWVVISYAAIVGLLSLIVPLSASAIVNAVMLGIFTTQLVMLCVVVAIALGVIGAFEVVKRYVTDVLQRRIFVRTSFEIAHRLPRMTQSAFNEEYAPEVVNRFFDVLTVQKNIGKFLLDGTSSVLITLIGLILLAVYHPFFVLFNIFLLGFVPILIFVLGRGGLRTSIKESKKKYAVASWLQEIARNQASFKLYSTSEYVYQRIDAIAVEYVQARHKHFTVLARQLIGSVAFRAFATVGVLGIGGSLVMDNQLSIGQLVAAELVVVAILSAMEKLIEQFENHYDLFTAVDKIAHVTDRPVEAIGGEEGPIYQGAASVSFKNVKFGYDSEKMVLSDITLDVAAGSRVSLVGASGSGKTTISTLLLGLYPPKGGIIKLNGYDISRLNLKRLRQIASIVMEQNEIFDGSIEENITMGRNFTYKELMWAMQTARMNDEVELLPKGLHTHLLPEGHYRASAPNHVCPSDYQQT